MPLSCPNLRSSLDLLTLKRASFQITLTEASASGDFTPVKQLKQEIETLTHSLHETILFLIV